MGKGLPLQHKSKDRRQAATMAGPDGPVLAGVLGTGGAQFFRAVLDALPQIASIIRPDGTAEFYNRALRDYAGAELGLDPRARLALVHPE
ncbi:MAG TPA: hypothetical protein VJO12_07315, partial [Stellaceae bacterium]|nr:hypothetical protein [Stellaceae bacterium]